MFAEISPPTSTFTSKPGVGVSPISTVMGGGGGVTPTSGNSVGSELSVLPLDPIRACCVDPALPAAPAGGVSPAMADNGSG